MDNITYFIHWIQWLREGYTVRDRFSPFKIQYLWKTVANHLQYIGPFPSWFKRNKYKRKIIPKLLTYDALHKTIEINFPTIDAAIMCLHNMGAGIINQKQGTP